MDERGEQVPRAGLSNADFANLFRQGKTQVSVDEIDEDFGGSKLGLGATKAENDQQAMDSDNPSANGLQYGSNNARGGIGSTTGMTGQSIPSFVQSADGNKQQNAKSEQANNGPALSSTQMKNLGQWEKHSKGFGKKMLAKMGFTGRLGKDEKGVSSTIKVVQRPAQMGLGYGDFQEASTRRENQKLQKELKGEDVSHMDVEEDDNFSSKRHSSGGYHENGSLWRKRKVSSPRRFKRAKEIQEQARSMNKQEKIVDMRGPSARVLTDISDAYEVDAERLDKARPKLGDELIYNVHMVVNTAQGKIWDLTQKVDKNEEDVSSMRQEAKLLESQIEMESVRKASIQDIMDRLAPLEVMQEDESMESGQSVEPVLSVLQDVRTKFPQQFDAYKLYQLVPSLCIPVLRSQTNAVDLLEETGCDKVVEQYRLVRVFLLYQSESDKDSNEQFTESSVFQHHIHEKESAVGADIYNHILEEALWTPASHCISVRWDIRSNPKSAVMLFAKFQPYLSNAFANAFIRRLILPKLKKACSSWSPQTDTSLIHEWLAPWRPYLTQDELDALEPDIRMVIASALHEWHPSDYSIFPVLPPWRDLWSEQTYAEFTHRYVVPKLIRCLQREFVIDPTNQVLDALEWTLAWRKHLPEKQFLSVLEGEFFPLWLKKLRDWICSSYELGELALWYRGWKQLFEEHELAKQPRVLIQLQNALRLLEAAHDLTTMPNANPREVVPRLNPKTPTSYIEALTATRTEAPSKNKTPKEDVKMQEVELRDVVENLAAQHNITFVPKGSHEGQQVYAFGRHRILFEQGVVFRQEGKDEFKPVDLDQLV